SKPPMAGVSAAVAVSTASVAGEALWHPSARVLQIERSATAARRCWFIGETPLSGRPSSQHAFHWITHSIVDGAQGSDARDDLISRGSPYPTHRPIGSAGPRWRAYPRDRPHGHECRSFARA